MVSFVPIMGSWTKTDAKRGVIQAGSSAHRSGVRPVVGGTFPDLENPGEPGTGSSSVRRGLLSFSCWELDVITKEGELLRQNRS